MAKHPSSSATASIFFNDRHRQFFYNNPKAVILFVSCIKEPHYAQEIADEWFTGRSPIFSKDNTISKMIDARLIVLEKKVGKVHYYRTPVSEIISLLSGMYRIKATEIQAIIKKDDHIFDYFEVDQLRQVFNTSRMFERHGLDYLNYRFSGLRLS